jgi:hypothetical protein
VAIWKPFKDLQKGFYSALGSGVGTFLVTTIFNTESPWNIVIPIIIGLILGCSVFAFLVYDLHKVISSKDNQINKLKNESVWDYFPVEDLEIELNRDHKREIIIRENIPEGVCIEFNFISNIPVNLIIATVSYRKKSENLHRPFLLWQYDGAKGLKGYDWKDDGVIVASKTSKEWTVEYKTDQLEDVQFIADLPEHVQRASGKIHVSQTKLTKPK